VQSGAWPAHFAVFISHFAIFISPLAAEDRVTARAGSGKAIVSGRIVDWTGDRLKIRSGEQVREIKADQVVDVESARSPKHVEGLKAFEAGKPDEANKLLTEALADEPREWVRRDILAALTRVDLARGDRAAAVTDFLSLVESDPKTRHFGVIPLDWGTEKPDGSLASAARSWLRGTTEVERLLGASILLFDPAEGETAYDTLNTLATAADRRVYPLARAQMWRRTLARGHVPEGEIERWEDRVNEIAEPLRGGAYSLIGRAWADLGNPERAATALLWLPLVYDSDTRLSADSEVRAADELTKIGRSADAVVLYREVLARLPYAPSAGRAKVALERMAAEAKSGAAATQPGR
jgi:tetratricopeptide (TPR) repeat protein